jgi:hypothetical protein
VKRFVVDCRKNYAIRIKGNVKVRCHQGWAIFPRRSIHGTIFSTAYILKLKTMSISTVSGGHAIPKAGKKKISPNGKSKSIRSAAKKSSSKNPAAGYDRFKTFNGKLYTGVQIGWWMPSVRRSCSGMND